MKSKEIRELHQTLQAKMDAITQVMEMLGDTSPSAPSRLRVAAPTRVRVLSRKHTMSPLQRKRLSAAMKQRWAARKRAGKTSLGGK
jgi:hypothetical protein